MAVTVTLIILIILILVLPGCNQKTKRIENTLRVSVVTYTHDDPFINATVDELKEELKKRETEERKIITSVRSADNDQKAQNEIVEEMIDAGCDILCVNLVDRTEPTTITDLAENKQVPIIFFNRELVAEDLERWSELYYVGADALRDSQIPREDWPGVVGIDGTDAGLLAVENGEMLGTVYNDKEGQAREMLNLAFAIATNGDKDSIPLIDGKYVRTPYHKVTQENVEDYKK